MDLSIPPQHSSRWSPALIAVVSIIVLILTAHYVNLALEHAVNVNTDVHSYDQSAYLWYSWKMRVSGYGYVVEGNRMPLYPFLLSWSPDVKLPEGEFFMAGKIRNIVLSIVLLGGVFLVLRRYFRPLQVASIMMVTGFTVFVFKAPYFQAEVLFYFFSFVGFVLMVRCLAEPNARDGLLAGATMSLAYLSKAGALAGFALFVVFMGMLCVYRCIRSLGKLNGLWSDREVRKAVACLVMAVTAFLAVSAPVLAANKRKFGEFFYHVSSFYVWYDSWEEGKRGTRAHGDRDGWPKMPEDLIPSAGKYFQTHSLGQIALRFAIGIVRNVVAACASFGWLKYVAIYVLLAAGAMAVNAGKCRQTVLRGNAFPIAFVLSYFMLAFVLQSWWCGAIPSGTRHQLAMFLPFIFVTAWVMERCLSDRKRVRVGPWSLGVYDMILLVVLAAIGYETWFTVPGTIMSIRGGA